jgi:SAM-dependent methyltransferase
VKSESSTRHSSELPHDQAAPSYGDSNYWNSRYRREPDPFDWYQPWENFKPIVIPLLASRNSALNLGCGNSRMSERLLEDGFTEVIGFDISCIVIDQNKARYSHEPRLKWVCGDVLNMEQFERDKFDVVFDKGTLDSIMCTGSGPQAVPQMLAEISRVLKPGALFVEVSYGTPGTRASYFDRREYNWKVLQHRKIPKGGDGKEFHYLYMAVKNEK